MLKNHLQGRHLAAGSGLPISASPEVDVLHHRTPHRIEGLGYPAPAAPRPAKRAAPVATLSFVFPFRDAVNLM